MFLFHGVTVTADLKSERWQCFEFHTPVVRRVWSDMHSANFTRLLKETLRFLLLWVCLDFAQSRGCSTFFCRKSHRVSDLNGVDPGSPLFLTPYIEKGAIDEGKRTHRLQFYNDHSWISDRRRLLMWHFILAARKLSLVGELPGSNVKSYAGYLTVNKKYNSNLFFWFFPALKVCSHFYIH